MERELVDTKTARALLGIGAGTLAYLIERGDMGDVYAWAPTGKQKRVLLLRARVEALAADSSWRRRQRG
jgi:hypothetical protein